MVEDWEPQESARSRRDLAQLGVARDVFTHELGLHKHGKLEPPKGKVVED